MSPDIIKKVIEAAMLAAGQPLTIDRMLELFAAGDQQPSRDDIKQAIKDIEEDCKDRGIELKKVASGYRLQVKEDLAPWIARLWEERPQRYTRALLETLALIAYRQPVTRGEIEDVRGVAVSSNIIKTLTERDWIKCVGHRDVPGKPALYGTTRQFLDYFSLKTLDELPPLSELRDFEQINAELDLELPGIEVPGKAADEEADDAESTDAEQAVSQDETGTDEADVAQADEEGDEPSAA